MIDKVTVDTSAKTIRARNHNADEFFGLPPGTNGTGPQCRRELVEKALDGGGYRWLRCDGRPAMGVFSVGVADGAQINASPWVHS